MSVVILRGESRLVVMSSSEKDIRPRILYAEDDVDVGLFVTEMLRDEGFEVTSVESGDDAAATLEHERFHLLLTDVRMPGVKDGIDLAIHADQHAPELPIIMVSGHASGLDKRLQALGKKITFLSKPFRFSDLSAAIHSALAA